MTLEVIYMSDLLFSVFPNENFVDLDYINMDGNNVHRLTRSVLQQEIITFSIMWFPEQEHYLQMMKTETPSLGR